MLSLKLPPTAVSDRVSITGSLPAGTRRDFADLDGPGCIRHLWLVSTREERGNRQCVLRIYFDDQEVPHVEAPAGDFFGVMHGRPWYPINTPYLSVQAESGYNCYFPMPFARRARIELEAGEAGHSIYLQVDWHRYPGQELAEPRRFCTRWRRERPTERYGEDFLMLDADGPGQLLGFAYGVRLIDDTDRWSHGGAENIYIDGDGEFPAYIRGIGGEDTFGTSYGGAKHPPETHLHAGIPYYVHEDTGEARPAQRLAGYRFFDEDTISFRQSLHLRFGCMVNDICATTWWYQEPALRPFSRLPEWSQIAALPRGRDGRIADCPRGKYDLPLPECGSWWLCGPFNCTDERTIQELLPAETAFDPHADYDGHHQTDSRWLTDGSRALGRDRARWVRRSAIHGFIDFNHVFRPHARGVGVTHPGIAIARAVLRAPAAMAVKLQLAWDDHLLLRVNGGEPLDLGQHAAFRAQTIEVPLSPGANTLIVKLSNTLGMNHGGWCFAFRAVAPDGQLLLPEAPTADSSTNAS